MAKVDDAFLSFPVFDIGQRDFGKCHPWPKLGLQWGTPGRTTILLATGGALGAKDCYRGNMTPKKIGRRKISNFLPFGTAGHTLPNKASKYRGYK